MERSVSSVKVICPHIVPALLHFSMHLHSQTFLTILVMKGTCQDKFIDFQMYRECNVLCIKVVITALIIDCALIFDILWKVINCFLKFKKKNENADYELQTTFWFFKIEKKSYEFFQQILKLTYFFNFKRTAKSYFDKPYASNFNLYIKTVCCPAMLHYWFIVWWVLSMNRSQPVSHFDN